MKERRSTKWILVIIVMITVMLASCAPAPAEPQPQHRRQQKHRPAARPIVYTNSGSDGRGDWLKERAAQDGFSIEYVQLGAGDLANRLVAERTTRLPILSLA